MNIIYSETIDREIHDEVNTKGKELSHIFGFDFPYVEFNRENIVLAQQFTGDASVYIDEKRAEKIIEELYGMSFPRLDIFINTTPFSTWNIEQEYVSISLQRFPEQVFSSFCHEVNHFMYDIVYETQKYTDIEVKEIITVINEVFGVRDYGWKIFISQRKKVFEHFQQYRDLKKSVEYAKSLSKL